MPIPPALDALIMDCLAKDPAQRPQTARELWRRLDAIDGHSWTEARAREWWTMHQPQSDGLRS
jgi:serine/threonine-protein kinase